MKLKNKKLLDKILSTSLSLGIASTGISTCMISNSVHCKAGYETREIVRKISNVINEFSNDAKKNAYLNVHEAMDKVLKFEKPLGNDNMSYVISKDKVLKFEKPLGNDNMSYVISNINFILEFYVKELLSIMLDEDISDYEKGKKLLEKEKDNVVESSDDEEAKQMYDTIAAVVALETEYIRDSVSCLFNRIDNIGNISSIIRYQKIDIRNIRKLINGLPEQYQEAFYSFIPKKLFDNYVKIFVEPDWENYLSYLKG